MKRDYHRYWQLLHIKCNQQYHYNSEKSGPATVLLLMLTQGRQGGWSGLKYGTRERGALSGDLMCLSFHSKYPLSLK